MKLIYILPFAIAIAVGVGARMTYQGLATDVNTTTAKHFTYSPKHVVANGVVEGASLEVAVLPEIVGRIAKIHARENQEFEEGEVLVELDNEAQKHALAAAQAELSRAEANLEKIRNGAREEERKAAEAVAAAKKVQHLHAKADYDRVKGLYAKSAASKSDLDANYFRMLEAEATWKQAKAELELIEAPARPEDIALAQAEVAAAQAKVKQVKADLDKTVLLAPFRGQVLRVYTEPGDMVALEKTKPVLTFADLSKRRVRAFIEELDCGRVKVGQTATVISDALPGKEYAGKVVRVFPRMGKQGPRSHAPGEYNDIYFREVLIELDTNDEIPINLRVEVRIDVQQVESASQLLGLTGSAKSSK